MSTPLWRQVYNAWEEAVTPGLQEITASNGFRDVLATAMKANSDVRREVERMSRQWLHLWNLPAATDVRRLRQQVAGLERELMALRLELERQETDGPAATGATKRSTTKRSSTKGNASTGAASKASGAVDGPSVASSNGRSTKA